MVADPRYFDRLGPLTLTRIAALSGAAISVSGDGDALVGDVAPLEDLRSGCLGYAEGLDRILSGEIDLPAGAALFVRPDMAAELGGRGLLLLEHRQPRAAFSLAAAALFAPRAFDEDADCSPEADVADSAVIGPGVVIGPDARIGEGVVLGPGCVIGPGCEIGEGSRIGAKASIACAVIGRHCNILAGAVIGEAGFGVAVSSEGAVDVPHLGGVRLGDRVTIGANSTVDRGVFGETTIGHGTKIDNLCHVGHNVRIGQNCAFAAFAGVSGSTTIGDGVLFGGRVGVADHLTIGSGARLGANAAVMSDVPAGETWAGAPAQPIRQFMREIAEIRRLGRAGRKKTNKKD